jgi:hypothetical protein
MREELQSRTVESYGELSSAHFGISTDDQAHIIGILRDRLYSDKIMAVLREYGTNAWDAHVDAGKSDAPIKVVLPSKFNPVLKIRDFGTGIAEEDIYGVYCKYGNSTKRDSNTAVGMLGIGCKSGFAYSDAFTVVSYYGGMKKTYSAFIDPSNLGQMTKLAEEPTDETGIEIQIPVQVGDVDYFRNKAQDLFKYFNPRPDINCTLPVRTYSVQGTGWAIRTGTDEDRQRGPVAIMGTIGYPIKTERLDRLPEKVKSLLNTSIDMFFPIGAVSIAASREDLEYTDKTMKAIQTTLEMCMRELEANLTNALNNAKTLYEARRIFGEAVADGEYTWTNGGRVRNLTYTVAMANKIWHGQDLSVTHYNPLRDRTDIEVRAVLPGEEKTCGVATKRRHTFYYRSSPIVALCDVKSQWINRAVQLRQELEGKTPGQYTILIVKFRTEDVKDAKTAYDTWIKETGLAGVPVYKLSDYEGVQLGNGSTGPKTVNKKTLKKVFKLKADSFVVSPSAPSDNYEVHQADLENGNGVWLEIHAFRPVQGSNHTISNQLGYLKAIGVDLTKIEIVGVKTKEAAKMGPAWTKFNDWYEQKIEDFVQNAPNVLELLRIQAVRQEVNERARYNYRNRARSLVKAGLKEDHPLVQMFTEVWSVLQHEDKVTENDRKKRELIYTAVANLPVAKRPTVSYNLRERQNKLVDAYPMLEYSQVFNTGYYGYYHNNSNNDSVGVLDAPTAKKIVDYVRLVDAN